jgi:homoserine kinase
VANLGPGFDALGMALNIYNTIELEETGSGLLIEISGEGERDLPVNEDNLVARAVEKLFEGCSYRLAGWRLRMENNIPLERGLGSSAAAIVGGLVAANAMAGNPFSEQQILSRAIAIEGHPDNVAAALLGGVVVVVRDTQVAIEDDALADEHEYLYTSFYPPEGLVVYAVVPGFRLSTDVARRVLPEQVSLRDTVFNIGRVALLAMALRDGRWEQLGVAVQDRLHQPYRAHLIPGLNEMLETAPQAGAYGAFLSGAGPTVVALGPPGSQAGEEIRRIFHNHGVEARVLELQPSLHGAYVDFDSA